MSSLHSGEALPPPQAGASSWENYSHSSYDFSLSFGSTVVIPSAVKPSSPAQTKESEDVDFGSLWTEYSATVKVLKRKILLRTYLTNPDEREALEEVGDYIKDLYYKYDRQWYLVMLSLKESALKLIETGKLPKDIAHESAFKLEKVCDEAWFIILEKFETEKRALIQWTEDVVKARAQRQPEPPKPINPFTNLFTAAANACNISFYCAKHVIEEYVRLCKSPVMPELGDTILLDAADIKDSLLPRELVEASAVIQNWLQEWHGVEKYFRGPKRVKQ